MRRVYVESPFAGRPGANGYDRWSSSMGEMRNAGEDARQNLAYAKALCRFLALRGDAPFASHLFATQYLDDTNPHERKVGIETCLTWGVCAQATVVGVDRGFTPGMAVGLERARAEGRPVEWLSLPDWRESWLPSGVERHAWWTHVCQGDQVESGACEVIRLACLRP